MPELADLSPQFKKFHLGCGTIFIKGYLNIGWWTHLGEDALYANPNGVADTYLYNHDLVKGIPAADNSLEVVYHSHLLEHLSNLEGIDFIAACYRVLQPGGLLRILVPDLELWAKNYINGNQFFFDEYRRLGLENNSDLYPTNGAVFMGMLHNHGHKMGYDFDTLKSVLQQAGFERIRRTMVQDSDLPDIVEVEPYFPLKALESLCIECYKPT
ncbi:methyltransferase domain-containing protein [Methylomonas sp. AM2-LC]|uniref:class I SAM-dependent methyltransferase n=1 Tax=Methylomonas sp. AM2-LC TaxID=3153301 RepID=UPI00326693DE